MMNRVLSLFILLSLSLSAVAQDDKSALQNNMDLLWIILAASMVFMMQAGFGLLESGMSRSKNSVNVIIKNYTDE